MSVTKTFLALMAAGVLLIGACALVNAPFFVLILYNVVCFGLLLADMLLSPKQKALAVTREANQNTLYYKTENKITVCICNNHKVPLKLEMKEDLPDRHFILLRANASHTVASGESVTFDYDVLPTKRGSFAFHTVHVKMGGVLGLCQKYFKYHLPVDMKVYPNLKDLSKYRMAMHKNRQLDTGRRALRIRGVGAEFESLREYVPGDDFKKINWLSSASANKLMVNQYEAEKNQPVFLLVDTGRPLSYSVKGYKKLDYAINAALVLADIVGQKGDLSGLMVFDTAVQTVLMPGKGQAHRHNLMEALYHVADTKNTSDYEGAFKTLMLKQKRKSLVFIFTDVETPEEAQLLAENMAMLKRHVPIMVLMKNEALHTMANATPEDMKGVYSKAMAVEALQKRRRIINMLNAHGAFCIESEAENFTLSVVNHYLALKNRFVV